MIDFNISAQHVHRMVKEQGYLLFPGLFPKRALIDKYVPVTYTTHFHSVTNNGTAVYQFFCVSYSHSNFEMEVNNVMKIILERNQNKRQKLWYVVASRAFLSL